MIDKANIVSPLLEHVRDKSNCFSNTNSKYTELRGHLLATRSDSSATVEQH